MNLIFNLFAFFILTMKLNEILFLIFFFAKYSLFRKDLTSYGNNHLKTKIFPPDLIYKKDIANIIGISEYLQNILLFVYNL